jgi:hypothetical protein
MTTKKPKPGGSAPEHLPPDALKLIQQIERQRLAFISSPQCRAWLRLVDLLGQAKADPMVAAWPAAKEFAERAQRQAGDSLEVIRVVDTRKAVDAAYRALPPSQQARAAAGVIARKLGISATAVRQHLIALGHRTKRK